MAQRVASAAPGRILFRDTVLEFLERNMTTELLVLVGTRKGAWFYRSNADRREWVTDGPHFLGEIVNHVVVDPRDPRTMLMSARAGHLGPTVYRSEDWGRTWNEVERPPAFNPARDGKPALAVQTVFWLSPGHAEEPGVWYAGTSPIGLFRSTDDGVTWQSVDGFNEHPKRFDWAPLDDETPDGPIMHSILVDPRDASHLYIGLSGGGTFESTDRGDSWQPLNGGVEANFMADPYPEYGQDPHCMGIHPLQPDRLYQANHCGIYRIDRPSTRWQRIGKNMPDEIGDIGFPIVLHPRDPNKVWVFPMDGTTVWPRTSPGGKPAAYRTCDAGGTWERQDKGLPKEQAWFTVKRQAFTCDEFDPLGLYFGTTSGELWMSGDEGETWKTLASHLPQIYSVVAVSLG